MKTFLGFILRFACVVGAIFWLASQSGTAHILWHGYVIETSAAFLCGLIVVLALVFYGLLRLWRFVRYGPEIWRASRVMQKLRQGYDDLTAGMVAVASGDATEAGRRAVAARKKIGSNAATHLLQAQAAQLAGDHRAARAIFKTLAADPDSAVLGYRGLIMAARRNNDCEEMDRLAEELRRLKGDVPWLSLVRFDLAVRQQKWGEAATVLSSPKVTPMIGKDYLHRARAAILVNESSHHDPRKALQAAEQAVKQAPDWLPAIIALARCQTHAGHRRAAMRTIEHHWAEHAHPALAALYVHDAKSTLDKYKLLEQLCCADADAPLSHLLCAEAALEADLWGEARRHLQALVNREHATQNAYRLFARLEKREHGDEQAASRWMAKAVDAIRDPVWLCHSCGGANASWQAACPHCNNFLTLDWQSPGVSRAAAARLMLPEIGW